MCQPINISAKEIPMTLRTVTVNLELGQTILVGPNDKPAKITKIEFHEKSGEVNINTTEGPRKVLTFKLCEPTADQYLAPADKYR